MSKIVLEFQKGGSFNVILNEKDAPITTKHFLEKLPYKGNALQARFAGEELFFKMPLTIQYENNVKPVVGDISFNAEPKWQAVCIYYGSNIRVSEPFFNLFGKLEGDFNELKEIGERIWKEGKEEITIRMI